MAVDPRLVARAANLDLHAHVRAVLHALRKPLDPCQQPHLLEHDRPPCQQQGFHLIHGCPQVGGQALDGASALGHRERASQRRQHVGVEVGRQPATLVLCSLGTPRLAPRNQLVHEDPQRPERVWRTVRRRPRLLASLIRVRVFTRGGDPG